MAGEVKGKKIQRLGEIDYTYPLISAKEIHLWPVEKKDRVYCSYLYWHYPRWYGLIGIPNEDLCDLQIGGKIMGTRG